MEVFIVLDKHMFGKGVFGIFSGYEKATAFVDTSPEETKNICHIETLRIIGTKEPDGPVFVAQTYDRLHDLHIVEGVYGHSLLAFDAAGPGGLVIRFFVDVPESKTALRDD